MYLAGVASNRTRKHVSEPTSPSWEEKVIKRGHQFQATLFCGLWSVLGLAKVMRQVNVGAQIILWAQIIISSKNMQKIEHPVWDKMLSERYYSRAHRMIWAPTYPWRMTLASPNTLHMPQKSVVSFWYPLFTTFSFHEGEVGSETGFLSRFDATPARYVKLDAHTLSTEPVLLRATI